MYDRGSDNGYLWIAMQFVRGTDAATWDSRAHEPAVTARLIGETASALDYANRHAVLHRDVKPGNILIADAEHGREIRSVLTDFGIARVTTANTQLTATGTFTATLAYASPEQLSGETVDHRSDQYSLACTLFAMYAGHPPYTATNPGQVVAGHLSQPVPRLSSARTDLPPAVDGVIARAMAKRRDERFSSATEFTDAFRDALEGEHIAAPTVFQPWTDPAQQRPGSGEHGQRPWADPAGRGPGSGEHVQPWAGPVRQWRGSDGQIRQAWVESALQAPAVAGYAQQPGWGQPEYGAAVGNPQLPHMAAGNPWRQGAARGGEPSKGAAMFAGIVTVLVSLAILAFLIYGITETIKELDAGKDTSGSAIVIAILTAIVAFTGGGGVLLLCARTAGRVMVIITGVFVVAVMLAAIAGAVASEGTALALAICIPIIALAVALIACAAAGSTGRWIRYRKALRTNRW